MLAGRFVQRAACFAHGRFRVVQFPSFDKLVRFFDMSPSRSQVHAVMRCPSRRLPNSLLSRLYISQIQILRNNRFSVNFCIHRGVRAG